MQLYDYQIDIIQRLQRDLILVAKPFNRVASHVVAMLPFIMWIVDGKTTIEYPPETQKVLDADTQQIEIARSYVIEQYRKQYPHFEFQQLLQF